jgi:hypothetical protein
MRRARFCCWVSRSSAKSINMRHVRWKCLLLVFFIHLQVRYNYWVCLCCSQISEPVYVGHFLWGLNEPGLEWTGVAFWSVTSQNITCMTKTRMKNASLQLLILGYDRRLTLTRMVVLSVLPTVDSLSLSSESPRMAYLISLHSKSFGRRHINCSVACRL